jgi:hypothetical protein
MNPELNEHEKLIQELYDQASDDVKHVVQQVLEVETANLHLPRPLDMGEKIVNKIKAKIVDDEESK